MLGQTINDRYRIEAVLGRGGMGTVYRASDLTESRTVALKVLHLFLEWEGQATLTRFHREFRVLARLDHPYIMQAYEYGTFEDAPYLVLELLEGETLRQELAGGPLARERSLHIARQLAEALAYLHTRSIIHRDLKPGNLMLLPPNDSPRVKLMDFGLVRQTDLSTQLTQEGVALGTVAYIAPEQAQALPVDFRADLYAFGVILYEMTTGRTPFSHQNPAMVLMQQMTSPPPAPRQFNPTLDEPLEQFILGLLAKEPAERPASTELVIQHLAQLADESVPVISPPGPEQAVGRADLIPRVPLIGRAAALADLVQSWSRAKAGQGQVILLSGSAGLGKTRLLTEIGLQVKMEGGQALTSHSREHTSLPYQPVIDILDKALGQLPEPVKETIPLELARLLPGVGAGTPGEPAPTDRTEARLRLFAACWDLLDRAAQNQPLLVTVEDVHWADPSTLELLDYLAQRISQAPILLVLSLRPEEVEAKTPAATFQRDLQRNGTARAITLESLTRQQVADFLQTALGQDSLPDGMVGNFQQATGGNPLFIEETLKALAAEGQLGAWIGRMTGQPATLSGMILKLPQNVLDLAERRLQLLAAEDRSILTAAAVLGPEFPFALLEAVTKKDEDELLDAIERLLASRLVEELPLQEGEDRYRFSQEALRQALLKTISQRRLRVMHRRSGEAMQAIYDTSHRRHWPVLAYHFAMAGDDQSALKYFTLAGDASAEVYANAEAANQYSRALEIARRAGASGEQLSDLFTRLGRVLELNSQFERALSTYDELAQLAREHDDRALELAALVHQSRLRCTPNELFNPEQGEKLSEQALTLARELDDTAAEAQILRNLVHVFRHTGRIPRAIECGERSLALVRELGERQQLAFTLNDIAGLYSELGPAMSATTEASDLWRELGNMPMLADSLAYACWLHSFAGDYEAAIAYSDESFKISQAANNLWGQSYSRYMVGLVYWNRGELDRAVEVMEEAIRLGAEAGFVVPGVTTRCWLALLYGDLGAVEPGIEFAEQAVSAAELHWERDLGFTLACLARLYLLKGDVSKAAEIFRQADQAKPLNDHWAQLTMWLRGQLALAQGQPDQAVALAVRCVSELRQFHNRIFFIPDALYLQGQAYLALDQPQQAYERLSEARAEAEAIGSQRTLWQILTAMAAIEAGHGKATAAETLRQQAGQIVDFIAGHAPGPKLHASFLNLPPVRALLDG